MSVAIEFPGTAVVANATSNNAALTATLPLPGAGILQYLSGFIIMVQSSAGGGFAGLTFNNLALGGGATPNGVINAPANQGLFIAQFFPVGWPASATATAINLNINGGMGSNMSISVFGYNVPV